MNLELFGQACMQLHHTSWESQPGITEPLMCYVFEATKAGFIPESRVGMLTN